MKLASKCDAAKPGAAQTKAAETDAAEAVGALHLLVSSTCADLRLGIFSA